MAAANAPMTRNSILNVSMLGSKVGRKGLFIKYKMYRELVMKKTFITVLYSDTYDQNKSGPHPSVSKTREI